jgi:YVTN family beta-propeller protein
VVSPDSTLAYVANFSDNTVSVINAQTNKVEKSLFGWFKPR